MSDNPELFPSEDYDAYSPLRDLRGDDIEKAPSFKEGDLIPPRASPGNDALDFENLQRRDNPGREEQLMDELHWRANPYRVQDINAPAGAGALADQIQRGAGGGTIDTDAGGMNKLPEEQREQPSDNVKPFGERDIHDTLIEARLNGHQWSDVRDHMARHYASGGTREQLGFAPAGDLMRSLDATHSDNMKVAMNNDPIMGSGSMIPSGGSSGDFAREVTQMGGGFGPRAAVNLGKPTPHPQTEGAFNYPLTQNGAEIGKMSVSFPEKETAFVNSITAGKIGQANPLGARNMIGLTRQFFEAHPEISNIGGWRVSGARQQAGTEGFMNISRQHLMGPGE